VDSKLGIGFSFPTGKSRKKHKLSRPWYDPFHVIDRKDPNQKVAKVYFLNDPPILVQQLRVCQSPDQLPPGFYWYGAKCRSPGRAPNWLQRLLSSTKSFPESVKTERDGPVQPQSGSDSADTLSDLDAAENSLAPEPEDEELVLTLT